MFPPLREVAFEINFAPHLRVEDRIADFLYAESPRNSTGLAFRVAWGKGPSVRHPARAPA